MGFLPTRSKRKIKKLPKYIVGMDAIEGDDPRAVIQVRRRDGSYSYLVRKEHAEDFKRILGLIESFYAH